MRIQWCKEDGASESFILLCFSEDNSSLVMSNFESISLMDIKTGAKTDWERAVDFVKSLAINSQYVAVGITGALTTYSSCTKLIPLIQKSSIQMKIKTLE